jgi:hypothetical protein
MRRLALTAAAALAFVAAGCGEPGGVTVYQGKPDTQPWDNEQFKGNRAEWEKAIKKRTEGQNEYARVVSN